MERGESADITLVNLNLMFGVVNGRVDFQVYNPLGVLYLAACLEEAGFRVDLRDYQIFLKNRHRPPFDLDDFMGYLQGAAPILGLSCMANLLPFTVLAARLWKRKYPESLVVLGGAGPTGVAPELIQAFPWIDYVCVGEGERALVELVRQAKIVPLTGTGGLKSLPGFFSRPAEHGPKVQPAWIPQPRITDLDQLPLPAYHLIDFAQVDSALSLITSRGCPYRCSFCTETNLWGNRVVMRSVESVISEVRFLAERASKPILLFQDDQLTLDRWRADTLFKAFIQADLGMQWKCFVRADQVDDELLALMAQAGCIQIRLGVESGSNRVLEAIHKGFTIEQAYQTACLALQYIPSVHASFIWGFPFETIAECRETLNWARRFQDAGCTILTFLLSPLPNSEIYYNYSGPLDFNPAMMPNFNNCGGEDLGWQETRIIRNAQYLFDFVQAYPHIFPGFFVYDYHANIQPKLELFDQEGGYLFRQVRNLDLRDVKGQPYPLADL